MSLLGKKPPAKPQPPKRTETEKKAQAAQLAEQLGRQMAQNKGQSKEDRIREIIEQDPEKAAELLRQMFLNK